MNMLLLGDRNKHARSTFAWLPPDKQGNHMNTSKRVCSCAQSWQLPVFTVARTA